MGFVCDFDGCKNDGRYELLYGLYGDIGVNFRQHRCDEHILSPEGLMHSSCGEPELIWDDHDHTKPRVDLVGKIFKLLHEDG